MDWDEKGSSLNSLAGEPDAQFIARATEFFVDQHAKHPEDISALTAFKRQLEAEDGTEQFGI